MYISVQFSTMSIVYAFTNADELFLTQCTRTELDDKICTDASFNDRFWRSRGSFLLSARMARKCRNQLEGIQFRSEVDNPDNIHIARRSTSVLKSYPFVYRIEERTLRTLDARWRYEDIATLLRDNQLTPQVLYGAINELRRVLLAVAKHAEQLHADYFGEGRRSNGRGNRRQRGTRL